MGEYKTQNVKIYITERAQYISNFNKLTKVRENKAIVIDAKMVEPEFIQFNAANKKIGY